VRWICTTPLAVTTRVKSYVCHSPPPGTFVWGSCAAATHKKLDKEQCTYLHTTSQHFLPSSQLVPTDDEMEHELIESWTEKLVQQPRPKRLLDNGFVPGPARPDSTTRRPKATAMNRKSWSKQKPQGGNNCEKKIWNKNHGSDTN
jgi:hypothetical protein